MLFSTAITPFLFLNNAQRFLFVSLYQHLFFCLFLFNIYASNGCEVVSNGGLMITDIEHLFMCSPVICISALESI